MQWHLKGGRPWNSIHYEVESITTSAVGTNSGALAATSGMHFLTLDGRNHPLSVCALPWHSDPPVRACSAFLASASPFPLLLLFSSIRNELTTTIVPRSNLFQSFCSLNAVAAVYRGGILVLAALILLIPGRRFLFRIATSPDHQRSRRLGCSLAQNVC